MAWQVHRPGRKGVYVKYFDVNTYKEEWIPRKLTKHLDNKTADEILDWIDQWERDNGKARHRSDRVNLKDDDLLNTLWKAYQDHRTELGKRSSKKTTRNENYAFFNYIVPFFVGKHKKKNPATWHELVSDFETHIVGLKTISRSTKRHILFTLERFGRELVRKQRMRTPFVLEAPAATNHKVTPLKVLLTPEEVIAFAKGSPKYKSVNVGLMALLGYFASLRPQELFALRKEDFLTGSAAEENCSTLARLREYKSGSRLGVVITHTLESGQSEPQEVTKSDSSRDIVNIWDGEAATMIAKILKDTPAGRLFPYSYDHLNKIWRLHGAKKLSVTPHDLRRASAVHLGEKLKGNVVLLKEHMRHSEVETTMLYLRKPKVKQDIRKNTPDFEDDVA